MIKVAEKSDDLIDFIFFHENSIRAAIRDRRLDQGGGTTGGAGTGHSKISDPTAAQGIRRASPVTMVTIEYGAAINGIRSSRCIKHPEKWLIVIADTMRFFEGKKQGEFIRRRYDQYENWQDTCKAMCCSKSCYYTLKADVLRFAKGMAIGYGMIPPWQK